MRALLISWGLLLVPSAALGWGFDGHRRLASVMQDAMPADQCLRLWLKARQTAALQDSACNPDRNRLTDPLEAPRHFLEIDWVNPAGNYPRDYAVAQTQLGVNNAKNNGQVPWRVRDQYALLVAAFASQNETQILDTVFFFSHYVMDSFSLLHDTKNFDPNGLHSRWESEMLQLSANINGITTLSTSYYGTAGRVDPVNNIFDIVGVGNSKVPDLIAADVATSSGMDASVHDIPAFYLAVKDLTARRWGDAVTMMSSLIWSAWVQAGSPALAGFPTACSMAGPGSEIILKGFPVPGGFTHPGSDDGGFTIPDGGTGSAGGVGGAGGGVGGSGGGGSTGGGSGGGSAGGAGGSGGADPGHPNGCGCASPGGLLLGAIALLWVRVRRR